MTWTFAVYWTRGEQSEGGRNRGNHEKRLISTKKKLKITKIRILQNCNDWGADQFESTAKNDKSDSSFADPHFKTLPMRGELKLDDCIVDKSTHKTLEEQDAFYSRVMLEHAREGHDQEDGWSLVATVQPQNVEIYGRDVVSAFTAF